MEREPIKAGQASIAGRAALAGKSVHVLDAMADPDPEVANRSRLGNVRTFLAVPLLREGVPIGVLLLQRTVVQSFSDKEIALAETFADQAVIAIENVRLFDEVQARTRDVQEALARQTATSDILRVISQSPTDVQPVFDSIVVTAARLLRCDFVFVLRNDGATFSSVAGATPEGSLAGPLPANMPIDPSANFPSRAILDKKMLHLPDWSLIELPEYELHIRERFGVNSALYLPLLREGECIGLLTLIGKRANSFGATEIAQAESFRDQALIALENTRLFNELEQRTADLSESLEQQTATADVLKVISSSPGDLEPVFNAMLENAARICDAKAGNIYRWDGEVLRLVASHNTPPAFVEFLGQFPVRPTMDNPVGRMLRAKSPVHAADLAAQRQYTDKSDPSIVAAVDLGGVRTLLTVPMGKDDELIGAFTLWREEVRPFADKQIDLVKNFAAQAVIAIENTRLLSELRQSLEQQTATADVLKVISSSPGELKPVFEAMLENATRICEASFGSMALREGDKFHRVAIHNAPPEFVKHNQESPFIPMAETPSFSQVVATRQIMHAADMRLVDPSSPLTKYAGARTLLLVPLLKDEELMGVFGVYRQEVRPFTDKQIELVKNFAAQAVIAIENTRLLSELRQSLEQQTATSEVLSVISSSPGELDPVFKTILENATRICGAEFGHLFRYEAGAFRAVAMHNTPAAFDEFLQAGPVQPAPGTGLARIAENPRPIHILDVRELEAHAKGDSFVVAGAERGHVRTLLIVPMLKDAALIGVIAIFRQEVRPFTDKQIALVTNFAAQAVIAIENARLLSELRQRTDDLSVSLEQQTATSDVLEVISRSAFDLKAVFETVAERAVKLCGADRAMLYRFDGELLHMGGSFNLPQAFRDWVEQNPNRPGRHSISARAALERQTVHVHDISVDPEYSYRATEFEPIRTALGVPILKGDDLLGVVVIYRLEVMPFTEKQIALVETFADQAAIAIENVRLFEDVQKRTDELSASLEQQTATSEVLKIISRSTFDLQTVLDTLVESAARLCEAEKASLNRAHGEGYSAIATYGFTPEFKQFMLEHPLIPRGKGSVVGRTVMTGETVQVADVTVDPDYQNTDMIKAGNVRTLLGVPMLREGAPTGVLVLMRSEVKPFTDKQIDLAQTFADQAVIAIENVRLFEEIQDKSRQVEEASKHKSQFLANMSHELRTPLNAILGYTELILDAIYGEAPEKMRNVLLRIQTNGKHLLGLINDVLDLSKIEAGQLVLSLNDYSVKDLMQGVYVAIEPLAGNKKLGLRLEVPPNLPPAHGDERRLSQVLLNLVGNAIKFTDSGEVAMRASAANGSYTIAVTDTGPGIAEADQAKIFEEFKQSESTQTKAKGGTGLGLSIAKRIVEMHGGKLWVESSLGSGSTFFVELPLRAEHQVGKA